MAVQPKDIINTIARGVVAKLGSATWGYVKEGSNGRETVQEPVMKKDGEVSRAFLTYDVPSRGPEARGGFAIDVRPLGLPSEDVYLVSANHQYGVFSLSGEGCSCLVDRIAAACLKSAG